MFTLGTAEGESEERAIQIANYIIESNATVRQTAKAYGVRKVQYLRWQQNGTVSWKDGLDDRISEKAYK